MSVQLISSIIATAIRDSCTPPATNPKDKLHIITSEAYTAIDFLFNHSDYYLESINIEPSTFRTYLLKQMYSAGKLLDITEREKKNFKWNHTYWELHKEDHDKHWKKYDERELSITNRNKLRV